MHALLSLSLALIGIWPRFGDDPLEASFPIEAKGDLHFQADAVLFQEADRPAIDVAIAMPRDAFEGPADSMHLAVRVEMLDRNGDSRAAYVTSLALPPDTSGVQAGEFPVPAQWIRLHPAWVDGTAGLRIRIEDETALKRGLLDKIRGVHRQGEVAARLVVPGGDAERATVSGLLFAWGQAPKARTEGSGLRAVRSRLQPNPYRFYGLYQPILTAYWEWYGSRLPSELERGTPLWLAYRIYRLPEESLVLEVRKPSMRDTTARWELERFDVSELRSGAYRLEAAVEDSSGQTAFGRAEGRFQILWEKNRWTIDSFDLNAVARVLLASADYDSFVTLGRGEQEAFLRDFWNRHDPTPPGQQNLIEQKFYERVAIANRQFGGYRPGMETDRGRVFIRYGPPDEVIFNLNPQDEDLLGNVLPQEIDDPGLSLDEKLRQTRPRMRYDNRAYEIWEYQIRGDPLIPEYVHPGMQTGLKFIFVDELGFGDYSLIYTSIAGGLQ